MPARKAAGPVRSTRKYILSACCGTSAALRAEAVFLRRRRFEARAMKPVNLLQLSAAAALMLGCLLTFYAAQPLAQPAPAAAPARPDCSEYGKEAQVLAARRDSGIKNAEAARESLRMLLDECQAEQRSRFPRRSDREQYCLESDPALRTLQASLTQLQASLAELEPLLAGADERLRQCRS